MGGGGVLQLLTGVTVGGVLYFKKYLIGIIYLKLIQYADIQQLNSLKSLLESLLPFATFDFGGQILMKIG